MVGFLIRGWGFSSLGGTALRTLANQRSASGVVSTPCGADTTQGFTTFRPRTVGVEAGVEDVWKD